MGNKSSKQKREPSQPSFSRTDTQGSTRSGRSIRSRRSQVVASEEPRASLGSRPANTPLNAPPPEEPTEGYPFPSVPRSLQIHEPKEPILLYRNTDGRVTNQPQPGAAPESAGGPGASFRKDSDPGVPSFSATPTNVPGSADSSAVKDTPNASGVDIGPNTPVNLAFQKELPFVASPRAPGASELLGGPQGNINIDDTIQLLLDAGYGGKTTRTFCLKSSEIAVICQAAREIFLSQPAFLELQPPVKIVGDTHGQFGDLLRLFNMCGFPPEANYLFLGDYVDRGKQSLETIMLLLCFKIKYPGNFFILRGNHECASVTRIYGFFDECKRRSSVKSWRTFIDTFNTLPFAALVAGKIFCVHGGLSPSLTSIDDIRNIERPTDVPDYGLLNDLLWSDPTDGPNEWEDNERGVSYCYNKVAINKFIQRFGYDLVCRAHMVVEDGYEFFNERSLVTVFSAPNYCGEFDNWGAVMSVSEELLCSFELLQPLDSAGLKQEMKREKYERRNSQLAQSL